MADYLEENPIVDGSHYSNFLPLNFFFTNETEAQILWNKFIQDLRNGAWGDHIAVRAISDMLNITINIISTQNPNIVQIAPGSGTSVGYVYIGLFEQLRYVGLDRISTNTTQTNDEDDFIDNENIHEGDEHTRQITGGPLESFMSVENPEADGQIFSIAPAEGQRPLSILTDEQFESMCNPDKFPYGIGAFNSTRDRKITY